MSVRTAAAWALVSQYSSFAIQFGASIVLARWFIAPADLGLFTIAFAAVSLITLLSAVGLAIDVGRLYVAKRDLPVVQAVGMVFAAVYIGLNILADVISILANPRLRHPK